MPGPRDGVGFAPPAKKNGNRIAEWAIAAMVGGVLVALGVFLSNLARPTQTAAPPAVPQPVKPAAASENTVPAALRPRMDFEARSSAGSLDLNINVANLPSPPRQIRVSVQGREVPAEILPKPNLGYDMTIRLPNLKAETQPLAISIFDAQSPGKPVLTGTWQAPQALHGPPASPPSAPPTVTPTVVKALSHLSHTDRLQIEKLASSAVAAADRCLAQPAKSPLCGPQAAASARKLSGFLKLHDVTVFRLLDRQLNPSTAADMRRLKHELEALRTDVQYVDANQKGGPLAQTPR
jgi:hypothetical protein